MDSRPQERGFTLIELLASVGIIGLVAAIALPPAGRTLDDLRLRGDARSLHNIVGLAKMRAGAKFSRTRVFVDQTTGSFRLQIWDKPASTWVTEGGSTGLSSGIAFGFGGLSAPPPNTQASIAQAAACLNDAGDATIGNTACVVFNSRGIPIDPAGAPTGNTAFYLTDDDTGVYAVTVSATPLVRLWWSPAAQTSWIHR